MKVTKILFENLKEKPEAVKKLKSYNYRGKKQFRIDFSEYISVKIKWTDVISNEIKIFLKEL